MNLTEKVNPIKITDKETNKIYTLDFTRATVKFAEDRGFDWDDVGSKPASLIELIWFTAFRRYHSKMSMAETTAMLEKLGGMKQSWLIRLRDLYNQALSTLIADPDAEEDEDNEKNASLTVELD